MFNWTTTRIVNSLKDYTNPSLDIFKVKKGLPGPGGTAAKVLHVRRELNLEDRWVTRLTKAVGHDYKPFEFVIDMTKVANKVVDAGTTPGLLQVEEGAPLTLNFYISLEGSEMSLYANDWYKKGRPFSIGFTASKTAQDMADELEANIKKFKANFFDGTVYTVINDGTSGKLTITGGYEHQRMQWANITADWDVQNPGYEMPKLLDSYEDGHTPATGSAFSCTERGINGFGTYYQLTKDLRLPTAEHTKAYKTLADELPIPGKLYNQYIITYCAPSMATPGFSLIGQRGMSETTHIFWVEQSLATDFEAILTKWGFNVTATGSTNGQYTDPDNKPITGFETLKWKNNNDGGDDDRIPEDDQIGLNDNQEI
ncbi:MAG: hypothetical protein HUJ56_03280 [Erysipelotrichaceae bacterium]|nr:hypothetical protein [Erysipelotrichaceae bacterium]